ncbi:unnamed protein product, partial [Medioppia subpectinata]
MTALIKLGDKTFFISAIMAMKNSRSPVFFGSMTANVVMNGISGYTTSDTTQEELEEAENELKKLDSKE